MKLTILIDRAILALYPYPPAGQAVCIGCSFNRHRSLIMPVDQMQDHVASHAQWDPASRVRIKGSTRSSG